MILKRLLSLRRVRSGFSSRGLDPFFSHLVHHNRDRLSVQLVGVSMRLARKPTGARLERLLHEQRHWRRPRRWCHRGHRPRPLRLAIRGLRSCLSSPAIRRLEANTRVLGSNAARRIGFEDGRNRGGTACHGSESTRVLPWVRRHGDITRARRGTHARRRRVRRRGRRGLPVARVHRRRCNHEGRVAARPSRRGTRCRRYVRGGQAVARLPPRERRCRRRTHTRPTAAQPSPRRVRRWTA